MTAPDGYMLGYHVVCVVDVLGQKDWLAQWSTLPVDGSLNVELVTAVKKSLGAVLRFRNLFEGYFRSAGQCTIPDQVAKATAEQKTFYERFRECTLASRQFSDTFLFYSPLANASGDLSAVQIHRMLGACCTAMLVSLAAGVPLRGGIAVGVGTEIEHGNFYGPALAEAHHLESRVAKYPRVVVSRQVIQFLKGMKVNPQANEIGRRMSRMAAECGALLIQDTDGEWIIDYMGASIRQMLGGSPPFRQAIRLAYNFVCYEEKRFTKTGNAELANRYRKLRRYMESRLSFWDQ